MSARIGPRFRLGPGLLACLCALSLLPGLARAIAFDDLPQQDRVLLAPLAKRWDGLSEERQQLLRRGAERWRSLSPQQRQVMGRRLQRWQKLSPEQRERIRRNYRIYRQLPADKRAKIRTQMRRFRELPQGRRQELRRNWRALSPRQRQRLERQLREPHRPGIVKGRRSVDPTLSRRLPGQRARAAAGVPARQGRLGRGGRLKGR